MLELYCNSRTCTCKLSHVNVFNLSSPLSSDWFRARCPGARISYLERPTTHTHASMCSSRANLSLSDLHFPSSELQTFSQVLSSLRRSTLSITNRLYSIEADARFVREVSNHYDLPLVANERCGSWYIPPEVKCASAYYKSTDGHTGQWNFSCRRLNLQLLPVAGEHGG